MNKSGIYFDLKEAITARQLEWDAGAPPASLSYRGNELAGEVGEACNIIKKLEREKRGIPGSRASLKELADELADVIICIQMIANDIGIDLDYSLSNKFNSTSKKMGFKTRYYNVIPK